MKFSIRDLLLVTVIAALAVGWWIDHRQRVAEARRLEENWNATKSELTQAEKRAANNQKIVSALRRAGLSDVHHPDGTVTVQRADEIDAHGFSVPASSVPTPKAPKD